AAVLVDRFLALAEIAEPRFFFSGVDFAGIEENVIKSGGGHDGADEKGHRVISLLKASPVSGGMIVATCRLLRKIVLTVAPASCRLSAWRLAIGAAGEDARRTAAGTATLHRFVMSRSLSGLC